jgi:hypothetical protein
MSSHRYHQRWDDDEDDMLMIGDEMMRMICDTVRDDMYIVVCLGSC